MTAPRSNASTDQNFRSTIMGVSTTDGTTPVPVEVDPTTGQLQVSSTGGGSSGTQYTDGAATIAHPIGTIPVFDKAGVITAVSAANPLPTTATITGGGDASAANQTTEITKLTSIDGKITAVNTGAVVVSSSALPTGAATAAKQPALGTAGSASTDVITVQGIASGTAQPISGSVTANAGTNLNTSALALETGGNLATVATNIPAKGQTTMSASTPVAIASDQSNVPVTLSAPPTDITASGTLNGNGQSVTLNLQGAGSVTINGAGALTGATVVFEWTTDGTTWSSFPVFKPATGTGNTSATLVTDAFSSANQLFWGSAPGFKSIRVRTTAYTSGTCTISIRASNATTPSIFPISSFVNTGDAALVPSPTVITASLPIIYNGSAWDRTRTVINATNSTGTGITAAGILAQFDDVSPTAITENQFGNIRMSANRNIYGTIRDAAGNERGANVDASNNLNTVAAATATVTGTTIYNNTALSSTKAAVNAAAGNLYGYHIYNPNSTVIYVQLFNVASASVTVGTTPPTAVLAVPAGGWADATPGIPITFATALTIAATTTSTGSSAPSTALLCNMWYK